MSQMILIKSACGASASFVDVFDAPLNSEGVVCCGNCKSIIACREAWYKVYGNPYGVSV